MFNCVNFVTLCPVKAMLFFQCAIHNSSLILINAQKCLRVDNSFASDWGKGHRSLKIRWMYLQRAEVSSEKVILDNESVWKGCLGEERVGKSSLTSPLTYATYNPHSIINNSVPYILMYLTFSHAGFLLFSLHLGSICNGKC